MGLDSRISPGSEDQQTTSNYSRTTSRDRIVQQANNTAFLHSTFGEEEHHHSYSESSIQIKTNQFTSMTLYDANKHDLSSIQLELDGELEHNPLTCSLKKSTSRFGEQFYPSHPV
jgi:hypothetical protein